MLFRFEYSLESPFLYFFKNHGPNLLSLSKKEMDF